jgi:hypothetical protein
MEAGGKQSKAIGLSEFQNIGNRKEMEEHTSLPLGSAIGQNKTSSIH